MKLAGLFCLFAFLSLGSVSDVGGSDYETVNGLTYERVDGRWFVYDAAGEKWEIAHGTISVQFYLGSSHHEIDQLAAANGLAKRPGHPSATGFDLYRYPRTQDPVAVLENVLASPLTRTAFLDTFLKFQGPPNDIYYGNQWNLAKIEIERAWDITIGDPSVTIAIIDGGSQYDHEDLSATTWSNPGEIPGNGIDDDDDAAWLGYPLVDDIVGWDFVDNDNDPRPGKIFPAGFDNADRHGTPCAGIAGAARNNLNGIAGVAGGCRIVHVRAETKFVATDALKYCWNKGVDVVSMSWTTDDPDSSFKAQIDSAYAHGVILVAAVGNNGPLPAHYPANHPKVIGVGATDSSDVRQGYSNLGPKLMAPSGGYGLDLWATDNEGTFGGGTPYYDFNPTYCQCPADNPKYFQYFIGTSASTPQVAGLAALVRSREPGLTNVEVRTRLYSAAVDLGPPGFDAEYGHGRIDAYRSLTKWGTIATSTTWSDTVYVSGDVVVASGVTLTVAPGTIVRIAADDNEHKGTDTGRIEFRVAGTVVAAGTGASPIVFESWTPTTTEDWVGFKFLVGSGGGTFVNCRIRRAEKAIESWVALTVKNTVIEDCGAGINVNAGPTLVQGCTLTRPGVYGLKLKAGSTTVRNTTIDTTGTACQVDSAASLTARNSQFLASDKGLHVVGNLAVSVDSTCVFNSNAIGIHCYNTSTGVTIKNSTIESNSSNGIFCDGGVWTLIQGNTISSNAGAVFCTNGASPIIRSNTVMSNTNGIAAAEGADPDIGHYPATGNNTIGLTTYKYVLNFDLELTLWGQNNCWNGDTSPPCGPPANKILGLVDTNNPNCCPGGGGGAPEFWPPPESEEPPPAVTELIAVVPNPFNPSTTIHYSVAVPGGAVELAIYDVAGRIVRTLVSGAHSPGLHQAVWEGTDDASETVASAVYFVKLTSGSVTRTMKLVLLK